MFHLYSFLSYLFITAYTPGPNNIMSMGHASRLGFRKSFPFNLGILFGFAIVMTLCTVFSAGLYALIPKIKPIMLFLGAAYMIYLAWKIWKSDPDLHGGEEKSSSFLSGCLLQFMNPKIMVYGITSMSSYILPFYRSPLALAGFVLLLSLIGFSGTVCWALFGSVFSMVLKSAVSCLTASWRSCSSIVRFPCFSRNQ
jgi:threonine/homoserine/homoserine lactone efflux protein